jgi:Fur family ferric uptake transcriptional regulator
MSKEIIVLKNFLAKKNLRITSRRTTILETFLKEEGHFTAEELYKKVVKKNSSIGIATVYRTLKLFQEAGLARRSQFGRGEARYEHNYLHGHHDHLICKQCGKIMEFENPVIEKLQEQIANKHQFKVTSHRLEMFGICSKCDSKQAS